MLLIGLVIISAGLGFARPLPDYTQKIDSVIAQALRIFVQEPLNLVSLQAIKTTLEQANVSEEAIQVLLTTLECSKLYLIDHNNILTLIDYSKPSNEKRLWVIDLKHKKILFHTYVSHGINSGSLLTDNFSNQFDSKASSIGIFKTESAYYGREGLSLRLKGLDKGFNDKASARYIVMHGGWYMDEQFIKKYGRSGRSWGCPALPLSLIKPVINSIKENSLVVAYYPTSLWFKQSRFLNCHTPFALSSSTSQELKPVLGAREPILFVDLNKNNKKEENEPIAVVSATQYSQFFAMPVPLTRMLRRQIKQEEYIALSAPELTILNASPGNLNSIHFVVPEVKAQRGYYKTEMKIVPLGELKGVRADNPVPPLLDNQDFTLEFMHKPQVKLKTTQWFIRWLGL